MRALLAVLLLGSLIVGWMWWQGRPRPVALAPTTVTEGVALPGAADAASSGLMPQSAEVVVHVIGSVKEPGLVRLPAGSRVDDAVKAAGGARSAKALSSVNLARQVVDGEQIVVGSAPGATAAGAGAGAGVPGAGAGGISINSATAAELEDLPGVGPVLAERIVQWRTANGPFRSIDELGEVSGIGDSVLGQIRTQARL